MTRFDQEGPILSGILPSSLRAAPVLSGGALHFFDGVCRGPHGGSAVGVNNLPGGASQRPSAC